MRFRKCFISFLLLFLTIPAWPLLAQDQNTFQGNSLQASNTFNPNISVIGWFQGEAGHRPASSANEDAPFQLKEAEIGFQSVVDAYAKADFFISVHDSEIDLEEGYINWFTLPYGLALKAGKFLANLGKFNRIHTPETAFADRPLVHEHLFGEEGLSGTGASLSWQVPVPFFLNLDLETITANDSGGELVFDKAEKKDLLYIGRLSSYADLSEQVNVTIGGSAATGPAGLEVDQINLSSTTLRNQTYSTDITFRWKNPRRAVYRSASWQNEIFWNHRDVSTTAKEKSIGLFSHVEYQFARRWRTGVRYDHAESPLDHTQIDQGGLLYLTFMPTEFSLISLQGRHVNRAGGEHEDLGFLKVTFNIGPHGSHPF